MLRRISLSFVLLLLAAPVVRGQQPTEAAAATPPRPALASGAPYREKSPERLRAEQRWQRVVARAQYQAAQRLARQERNAWLGHMPLRPAAPAYRLHVALVPVYYDWLDESE